MNFNKELGYVYILTRSTSGRLHTCKNPSFHEPLQKTGRELIRQQNIDPAVVLGV